MKQSTPSAYTKKKGTASMKKTCLCILILILICRFLYPYTRFGFQYQLNTGPGNGLNMQTASMKPGEKITLRVTGIKKLASYSSSDFRVACVSPSGVVHALQPGTAIIYVRQGEKEYKCKITVS